MRDHMGRVNDAHREGTGGIFLAQQKARPLLTVGVNESGSSRVRLFTGWGRKQGYATVPKRLFGQLRCA